MTRYQIWTSVARKLQKAAPRDRRGLCIYLSQLLDAGRISDGQNKKEWERVQAKYNSLSPHCGYLWGLPSSCTPQQHAARLAAARELAGKAPLTARAGRGRMASRRSKTGRRRRGRK